MTSGRRRARIASRAVSSLAGDLEERLACARCAVQGSTCLPMTPLRLDGHACGRRRLRRRFFCRAGFLVGTRLPCEALVQGAYRSSFLYREDEKSVVVHIGATTDAIQPKELNLDSVLRQKLAPDQESQELCMGLERY
ncbi:hypothetical protein MTO96_001112 [Rhipicephalus appendiculatus]